MKPLISELQHLSALCSRVQAEMSRSGLDGMDGVSGLHQCILQSKQGFAEIERISGRLSQLLAEWENQRDHADPQSREETRLLISRSKKQALQLQELCAMRKLQLKQMMDCLQSAIGKLRTGKHYLNCIKPIKSNFPKFLDAHL
jgi:hypothetical protein